MSKNNWFWISPLVGGLLISQLHSLIIKDALVELYANLTEQRPDIHVFLDVLRNELARTGEALCSKEARDFLATFDSGKAAKLAKAVLAIEPAPHQSSFRQQAIALAIEARLNRFQETCHG